MQTADKLTKAVGTWQKKRQSFRRADIFERPNKKPEETRKQEEEKDSIMKTIGEQKDFGLLVKKEDGYHFGIKGIKERTDFLGETFKIYSLLNEGTEIMITIEI